jgi:hypothetical protein
MEVILFNPAEELIYVNAFLVLPPSACLQHVGRQQVPVYGHGVCGGRKAYHRSATCLHVDLQPLPKELV